MKRTVLFILVAVVGLNAGCGKSDLENLQGSWTQTRIEFNGAPVPSEVMPLGAKMLVKDETITITDPAENGVRGRVHIGKLKIDPSKSPKTIDLEVDNRVQMGIYKIEGDMLTVCASLPEVKDRPKEFASTKAIQYTEFRRDKK